MSFKRVQDADLAGKRVLVRVDFNVPLQNGAITDDTRIREAIPTIKFLLDEGATVILMSHLGRPKGKPVDSLRLAPVAARLSDLLGTPVLALQDVAGEQSRQAVEQSKPGDVLLLENLRFEAGEEKNDPALADRLAGLADLYVNDAFGAAHRAHSSTEAVAHRLPAYAGMLMQREIEALGALLETPKRPFIGILGGAKVSDKIDVITNLMTRVDALLLGGGMANTFLYAQGYETGQSLAERDFAPQAKEMLDRAAELGVQFLLPIDVVVSDSIDGMGEIVSVAEVGSEQSIFDIGPETVHAYSDLIATARTIFWNGPMGVFEKPEFANGTIGIAKAVAAADAFSVVGGGDSVAAINDAGLQDQISHISTGGGASLELIEGKTLPGIGALEQDSQK